MASRNDGARFRPVPLHEVEIGNETPWLIHGLVPSAGVMVVYGPSGVGKTFVVIDLVCHVALGIPYRSRRVEQGPVIYFAAESHRGFERRCVALRREKVNGSKPPFYAIADSMSLIEDHDELVAAIRQTLGDVAPAAIVIDTLNKTMCGSETRDDHMSAYYQAANAVHRALGCTVIIVHHTGWDTSHMRGHSLLPANVETSLSIRRKAYGNVIVMKVEKQREGESGFSVLSCLREVKIGIDKNGDPITSCVVEPADVKPVSEVKAHRLRGDAETALTELKKLDDPASIADWRSATMVAFAGKPSGAARRVAFSSAKKRLKAMGIITIKCDTVSVSKASE